MDTEFLVVRGRTDRAGQFQLRRAYSTRTLRHWPEATQPRAWMELLDAQERVLHREAAELRLHHRCAPLDVPYFDVLGAIQLRPDAADVRLVIDGQPVWSRRVADAPTVKVRVKVSPRLRQVEARIDYSAPGEGAWISVVYQWGRQRFRVLYDAAPVRDLTLSLEGLPGGTECRVVVSYSNGVRTAQSASQAFALPRLAPSLAIVSPAARQTLLADSPVMLKANLVDDESAEPAGNDDIVWSVDGDEVARGLFTSIDGLAPGRHDIVAEYRARPGARANVQVRVRAANVASARHWDEWDFVSGNN